MVMLVRFTGCIRITYNCRSFYFFFFFAIIADIAIHIFAPFSHFFKKNWFISNQPSELKLLSNFQSLVILQKATTKKNIKGMETFLELSKFRSSHPEVFLRKGVLKICSKFTEERPCRSVISTKSEHPCQSVISIKLQSNFIVNKILGWLCNFTENNVSGSLLL